MIFWIDIDPNHFIYDQNFENIRPYEPFESSFAFYDTGKIISIW